MQTTTNQPSPARTPLTLDVQTPTHGAWRGQPTWHAAPWSHAPQWAGNTHGQWNAGHGPQCFASAGVEMADEGTEYVCRIEVPGVKSSAIELACTGGSFAVSWERPSGESSNVIHSEIPAGPVRRAFPLPTPVHSDQVRATLADGILTVVLPKVTPSAAARIVPIQE